METKKKTEYIALEKWALGQEKNSDSSVHISGHHQWEVATWAGPGWNLARSHGRFRNYGNATGVRGAGCEIHGGGSATRNFFWSWVVRTLAPRLYITSKKISSLLGEVRWVELSWGLIDWFGLGRRRSRGAWAASRTRRWAMSTWRPWARRSASSAASSPRRTAPHSCSASRNFLLLLLLLINFQKIE